VNVAPVAVPTGFTTVIGPVVAPAGTVVEICVSDTTVNTAFNPLNRTAVTPLKFVPVIVTTDPAGPIVGENEEITGKPTMKLFVLVPVPNAVVTLIRPDVAPVGTVAVICVGVGRPTDVAFVLLKRTWVAPQRFVPVIVTSVVPAVPNVGLNPVTVGAPACVTSNALVALPSPLVTWTLPSVALHGTLVEIVVAPTIVNAAATPLNVTDVTFGLLKFVPVIVTVVPGAPLEGFRFEIVGAAADAGSAVTSTPTIARPIVAARVRTPRLVLVCSTRPPPCRGPPVSGDPVVMPWTPTSAGDPRGQP
jgi:hypothetical protein